MNNFKFYVEPDSKNPTYFPARLDHLDPKFKTKKTLEILMMGHLFLVKFSNYVQEFLKGNQKIFSLIIENNEIKRICLVEDTNFVSYSQKFCTLYKIWISKQQV